jgi:integrase
MAQKKVKTECSGLEWSQLLILIDRLKKEKNYRFLLFVGIGCYCGLRCSDILSLYWKDIVDKSEIEIREKKTGKSRTITINQSLIEIINHCYENQGRIDASLDDFVFCNRTGNKLSIQYVNRQLHEIFNKYKIRAQNYSSHILRKTFGRRCYEMHGKSPESLVLLSQIFSHSSIAITRQYIGISQEKIQNVYISL